MSRSNSKQRFCRPSRPAIRTACGTTGRRSTAAERTEAYTYVARKGQKREPVMAVGSLAATGGFLHGATHTPRLARPNTREPTPMSIAGSSSGEV